MFLLFVTCGSAPESSLVFIEYSINVIEDWGLTSEIVLRELVEKFSGQFHGSETRWRLCS